MWKNKVGMKIVSNAKVHFVVPKKSLVKKEKRKNAVKHFSIVFSRQNTARNVGRRGRTENNGTLKEGVRYFFE